MHFRETIYGAIGLAAVIALIGGASTVRAADHLDSPSVEEDGRLDINDVYVFQSPQDPSLTVLAMTTNPLAGVLSPLSYNTAGVYEFNLDADLDGQADQTFSVTFESDGGSEQTATIRKDGEEIGSGPAGKNFSLDGGGRFRADIYEDPFFFDLNGFNDGLQFTGDDFFAGAFTAAIVFEVPSDSLIATQFGLWCRTTIDGEQFDRMARPAINTALFTEDATKNAFNDGQPGDDFADFGAEATATIATYNGGDEVLAEDIACLLLPDIMTVDVSLTAGFPNGRRLQDDVINIELTLLSNGGLTTDGVDFNDRNYRTVFPYLARTLENYYDRRPRSGELNFYAYAALEATYAVYASNTSDQFALYAYLYAYYAYLYELELQKIEVVYFDDGDLSNYANLRYTALQLDVQAFVLIYYSVFLTSNGAVGGDAVNDTYISYLVQLDDLQDLTDNGDDNGGDDSDD